MVRIGVISVVFGLALGVGACGGGGGTQTTTGAVTFWQDVAPIYNSKCVRCHQEGGIAPFPLDNYADAQAHAALEKSRTAAGTMPPYFMVNDGSCQSFQDDVSLTAAQKSTIAAWVDGGTPEGTPATLTLPPQPALANAVDVATPLFTPGGPGGSTRGVRRVPLLPVRSAGGLGRLARQVVAWAASATLVQVDATAAGLPARAAGAPCARNRAARATGVPGRLAAGAATLDN